MHGLTSTSGSNRSLLKHASITRISHNFGYKTEEPFTSDAMNFRTLKSVRPDQEYRDHFAY